MILHYVCLLTKPHAHSPIPNEDRGPHPSTPQLRGGMAGPDSLLAPPSLLQNNKLYSSTRHPKGAGWRGYGVYCAPHEKHITSITSLNPPSCFCSVTLGSAGRGATSDSGRSRGLGLGAGEDCPKGGRGGECDGAYPVFFAVTPRAARRDRTGKPAPPSPLQNKIKTFIICSDLIMT